MKVITISGHAEAGKDTVAKQIKKQLRDFQFNKKVIIIHYADLLKYICKQYFGWDGKKDENGRALLQHIGTDIVRNKDENFWVSFVSKILEMFENEWDYVLIPDCRFPNEANTMKCEFDALNICVIRPGYQNHLTAEQRMHPSETAMDDFKFDYVINNPGNEGLADNVKEFIRRCL